MTQYEYKIREYIVLFDSILNKKMNKEGERGWEAYKIEKNGLEVKVYYKRPKVKDDD